MPDFSLTFHILRQQVDDDLIRAEVLFFPETTVLTRSESAARRQLTAQVKHLLSEAEPLTWFRRRESGSDVHLDRRTLTVDPPRQDTRWLAPVELTFDAIRWQDASGLHLGYVPLLGIEVFAESDEELSAQLDKHIEFALKRNQLTRSLGQLLEIGRRESLTVEPLAIRLHIPTPKELDNQADVDPQKSVLDEVTTRWSDRKYPPAFERDAEVDRLQEILTGEEPRSVLLVGPSGVGKTAVVHELVRTRKRRGLPNLTVRATSGARLVAGASGFGMWQQRCTDLVREADPEKVILHLGNLVELTEVGRGGGGGQGIAQFLASKIDRGDLRVVVECTPEQKEAIERRDPGLLSCFEELPLKEPDEETGRAILMDYASWMAPGEEVPLTLEAIQKLDRLHRRYATYSVYPGRPIRFLRNLLEDRAKGVILSEKEITVAFSSETGLPLELLDESIPLDLAALKDRFESKVIGQPDAVSQIVDLLAAVKAGLTQPDRPIASLLLIGPTGVGKTETAKAIADYCYGDPSRMIRIDMSEYADPLASQRLIGGGAFGEGVLTGQVRDQPFGVVLFDEFEKAHPLCFDLLLQVLGEGRLTDSGGHLADFRNALVVMTSNLGVESAGRGGVGFVDLTADDSHLADHYMEEVRKYLRPELYNRIDRIIPFAPLGAEVLRKVCRKELGLVRQRDGLLYRDVPLTISDDVIDALVKLGSDRRYGARPLKRAIERELLTPLAEGVNSYQKQTPLRATASVTDDNGIDVEVKPLDEKEWKTAGRHGVHFDEATGNVLGAVLELRRWAWKVRNGPGQVEVRNERYRLEADQQKRVKENKPPHAKSLVRLQFLNDFLGRFDKHLDEVVQLETQLLCRLYRRPGENAAELPQNLPQRVEALKAEQRELLLLGYATLLEDYRTQRVWMILLGRDKEALAHLARGYLRNAKANELRAICGLLRKWESPKVVLQNGETPLGVDGNRNAIVPREQWLKVDFESDEQSLFAGLKLRSVVGLILRFDGPLAFARFEPERGGHVWKSDGEQEVRVDTTDDIENYGPPDRANLLEDVSPRRTWRPGRGVLQDALLGNKPILESQTQAEQIADLVEEQLEATARREVM